MEFSQATVSQPHHLEALQVKGLCQRVSARFRMKPSDYGLCDVRNLNSDIQNSVCHQCITFLSNNFKMNIVITVFVLISYFLFFSFS